MTGPQTADDDPTHAPGTGIDPGQGPAPGGTGPDTGLEHRSDTATGTIDADAPDGAGASDTTEDQDAHQSPTWWADWRPAAVGILHVILAAVAVLVAGWALVARSWLGWWAWGVVGLTAWAGALLARWPRSKAAAAVATLAYVVVAIMIVAAWPVWWERPFIPRLDLADRVLGRDIPPAAAMAAWWAALAAASASFCLAILRGREITPQRRPRWQLVTMVVVSAGPLWSGQSAATEWVYESWHRAGEEEATFLEASATAEQTRRAPAPPPPFTPRWNLTHTSDFGYMVPVDGWDVMVTVEGGPLVRTVAAVSTENGALLWTYTRLDDVFDDVFVDARGGHVVLLAADALLVLNLEDGERVAAHDVSSGRVTGVFDQDGHLALVSTLPSNEDPWDPGHVAVLDLSTGETVASQAIPDEGCTYEMAADHGPPVVLRWGSGRTCSEPTLFRVGPAEQLERLVTVDGPSGTWAGCDSACNGSNLQGNAQNAVLALKWNPTDASSAPIHQLVGIHGRREAWRTPATGAPPQGPVLVTIDQEAVVAQWAGQWHRISHQDGSELAVAAATATDDLAATTSEPAVVDGQAYTADCGHLVIRDLHRLTVIADLFLHDWGCATPEDPSGRPGTTPPESLPQGSTTTITTDGALVVEDHRQPLSVQAYVPADPGST